MDRRSFLKKGAVAGFVLAAPSVSRGASPITLRWAHYAQENHPAHTAAKSFAEKVEAQTGGAVKINIFPNNVLGGPPPSRHNKSSWVQSTWGCRPKGSSTNSNRLSAQCCFPSSSTDQVTPIASSTGRASNGWPPSPKSRASSCFTTGITVFAISRTACGPSTRPMMLKG